MERLGVIERAQEPTDWVNSMVTVVKPNGKLQICIDPHDLYQAIKHEFYPMTTIEEIAARMPNAKLFSKLDASSVFWQVTRRVQSSVFSIPLWVTTCSDDYPLAFRQRKMSSSPSCLRCSRTSTVLRSPLTMW